MKCLTKSPCDPGSPAFDVWIRFDSVFSGVSGSVKDLGSILSINISRK